jgi:hypothetical protein
MNVMSGRKAMAIQGVGIVSTIGFSSNATLKNNFENGVRDGNAPGVKVYYAI